MADTVAPSSVPPALLPDVAAFVFDPAHALEPEQRHALFAGDALLARLMASDRRVAAVACREWLQQAQLDCAFMPDPADARQRVALASPASVQQLGRKIGVSAVAPRLRKVIQRAQRAQLDTWMSADDWAVVSSRRGHAAVLPDALFEGVALESLEPTVLALGQAWLTRFAHCLAPPLAQRMVMRLPVLDAALQHSLSPAQARALDALSSELIVAWVLELAAGEGA